MGSGGGGQRRRKSSRLPAGARGSPWSITGEVGSWRTASPLGRGCPEDPACVSQPRCMSPVRLSLAGVGAYKCFWGTLGCWRASRSKGAAEHPVLRAWRWGEGAHEAGSQGWRASRPKLGKEKGHPAASALPSSPAGPPRYRLFIGDRDGAGVAVAGRCGHVEEAAVPASRCRLGSLAFLLLSCFSLG